MAKLAKVKTVDNSGGTEGTISILNKVKMALLAFPAIVWLMIIPCIIKKHSFANPLKGKTWFYPMDTLGDYFLFYKAKWIMIDAILMILVLLLVYLIEREFRFSKKSLFLFIPIAVYAVMAIISTALSDYKDFALQGAPDQFESIFVILSYLIGMIYFYHVFVHYNFTSNFIKIELVSCVVIQFICISQFIKKDIFTYILKDIKMEVSPGEVYGTFYNKDYTGMYMILILPMFFLLAINAKKTWLKAIYSIASIAILFSMIGSGTVAAMLSVFLVIALYILIRFLNKEKREQVKKTAVLIITAAVPIFLFVLIPLGIALMGDYSACKKSLEYIYTEDDFVEMKYKGNVYYISYDRDDNLEFTISIQDQNKNELPVNIMEEKGETFYKVDDNKIKSLRFYPEIYSTEPVVTGFSVKIDEHKWYFSKEVGDNSYYYLSALDCYEKITEENKSPNFEPLIGKDALASDRGFIWNKAIVQVINNNLIIGSGPDSFVMTFPNNDYVDKFNNGYMYLVISKPHCLLLQMATQTGLISMIAFVVFYLWYFANSLKIYVRTKIDTTEKILGLSALIGTTGYMFSSLINDSSVTVAYLFWAMMGIGIAINEKIKKNEF